ncbi:DUF4132 domain-containing protein [Micromonospora sp. NPDC050417]|uniref:DUF4132 domain-containing protein n=1 Tax=Micromonospora sp. NPDC050417 TaxID=3364280 RepID=UPI0037AE7870
MRNFQFVSGDSAKYWRVNRDGSTVIVQFGRVGANGTSQAKEFPDEEAAAAHVDKCVAEKLRKGYVEVTAAAPPNAAPPVGLASTGSAAPSDSSLPEGAVVRVVVGGSPAAPATDAVAAAVPDEDILVPPSTWRRNLRLRRGGWFTGTPMPAGADATGTEYLDSARPEIHRLLQDPGSDPELRAAALLLLDGDRHRPLGADPAVGSPLGAAALMGAAARVRGLSFYGGLAQLANYWAETRGLLFAAEAAVALAGIYVDDNVRRATLPDFQPQHVYRGWPDSNLHYCGRIRDLLATASEADYAAVERVLQPVRQAGTPLQRLVTSFLLPTRTDWVEEDTLLAGTLPAGLDAAPLLLPALHTAEQLERVSRHLPVHPNGWTESVLPSLLEGVGAAALPVLLRCFDAAPDARDKQALSSLVALLPADEAFQALLDRIDRSHVLPAALHEAAAAYPRRAVRLMAQSGSRTVDGMLRLHLARHRELVDELLPTLPALAADRIRAIDAEAAAMTDAPTAKLPAVLVSPPWSGKSSVAKSLTIPGLAAEFPPAVSWLPGERDEWLAAYDRRFRHEISRTDLDQLMQLYRTGGPITYGDQTLLLAKAPEELVRPLLAHIQHQDVWNLTQLRVIVARHGTAALPAALRIARVATTMAPALLPLASPELATLMADWCTRSGPLHQVARTWLERHPLAAARALVPASLGKAGSSRRRAEATLRLLAGAGHRAVVLVAAAEYGEAAAVAVGAVLDQDPLDLLPTKMPVIGDWADPASLPRIPLRDGSGALPHESVRHLLTMLAMSKLGEPYPGVAIVKEVVEPRGLAEFGWAVFERWQAALMPPRDSWALESLGLTGDDETIRRLAPIIRAWPGEGGHARAVTGLDVLAALGSDVALMHLNSIAQRVKFKGLKEQAVEKVAKVAEAIGLTGEQLADRLVPDLGLATDGTLRLDYGPRQFVVTFDEQLKPCVTDAAGGRSGALPKPGTGDDATLANEAYTRFAAVRKNVRSIAADQLVRLEQAMVTARRWTVTEFRELLVAHPLLWHLVRRLVWGVYELPDGPLRYGFRIAEDRTFVDATDNKVAIADEAVIGLVHPIELGTACAGWATLFANHQTRQPFPQLDRKVFVPTPEVVAALDGQTVPTGRILGLEQRGWRRGGPQDGGIQGWIERTVRDEWTFVVGVDPGIAIGAPTEWPEQKLDTLGLYEGAGVYWWFDRPTVPLDRLDPVTASEIIRDITELTAK